MQFPQMSARAGFVTLLVLIAVALTALDCETASASTVAYWRFEEGTLNTAASGANSILDSSGNNLHGTPAGNPVYRAESTPVGSQGLEFNIAGAQKQGVQIPDNPLFQLSQSITVEAYIRLDSYPNNPAHHGQIVFRGDDVGGNDPFFLAIRNNSGELVFRVDDGPSTAGVISPNAFPLNTLLHVAGTLDDATGEMKLFIDGQEVASTVTSVRAKRALNHGNPRVAIGNLGTTSQFDQLFPGFIDEVRISDVALLPSEFVGAYQLPPGPYLLYDPATGNVKMYAEGETVGAFNLQSAGQFLTPADFTDLAADTGFPSGPTDNTTSAIGWVSGGSLFGVGFDGPAGSIDTPFADLGNILPTGLALNDLRALLTNNAWSAPLGISGSGEFGLVVQPVPEPAGWLLLAIGLIGIGWSIPRRKSD